MKLIAFVGFKQSGKTTASQYLQEKHGYIRHNFKDALVREIKQNFPWRWYKKLKNWTPISELDATIIYVQ